MARALIVRVAPYQDTVMVWKVVNRAWFAGAAWFSYAANWFAQHGVIMLFGFGWRDLADVPMGSRSRRC